MSYYPPSSLIATGILLPVLGLITVATRFWIRLSYHPNPIGIDDWAIVVGALVVTSLGLLQVCDTVFADLGDSADWVGQTAVAKWKGDYAQVITEKIAFGSIKLSVLFFYRRIFGQWSDFLKVNNALVVLVTIWALTFMIGEIFECGLRPDITWTDREAADNICLNDGAFLISFAATDVLTDLLVIGTPLAFVHRLRINKRQRRGLVAVFLIGFLSTLAGILRLVFLSILYQYNQLLWVAPTLTDPPHVLKYINLIFWTNVELCCGVIAVNLMTFGPLIRKRIKDGASSGQVHRKASSSADSLQRSMKEKSKRSTTVVSSPESVSEGSDCVSRIEQEV